MAEFDLKAAHDELQEQLAKLDELLDAATGDAETAGKRKITNELIEASKAAWTPISESLTSQLSAANEDVRIGVFYGLLRDLQKTFGDSVSKLVDDKVAALPKPAKVEVSDDQLKEMQENRSALYKKITTLIEMAKSFDQAEGMVDPPKRRANKGAKAGPRAISFVNWFIDDKEYENLTAIIKEYGQYEKTVDLRNAMKEKGIDLKNPPARFEFTMPDGKTLVGTYTPPAPSADDDDEEEESEETETSE